MTILMLLTLCVVALAAWAAALYYRLSRNTNRVAEGFSGLDAWLTRRAVLVPGLIETVRGFLPGQTGLLESLSTLHAASLSTRGTTDRLTVEELLGLALRKVLALARASPECATVPGFQERLAALDEAEAGLGMARTAYNQAVRELNTAMGSSPARLAAMAIGFRKAKLFETGEADRQMAGDGVSPPA